MKKLIFLFGMLLIVSNLSAQLAGGLLGYFYEKPVISDIKIQYVQAMKPDFQDYINNKTYSFFNEGKLYMLSYEDKKFTEKEFLELPETKIERNLYLYRLDTDGWKIASDKPIMTGYVTRTSYESYFPWRNADGKSTDINVFRGDVKNGSVTIGADGTVTIILICHTSINLDKPESKVIITFYNPKPIILKPNGDGTYNVQ